MGRNLVETVMGAVVLMVAGIFLVFAYTTSNLRPVRGYEVFAIFNSVDGLTNGADVRIGGVKVGSVIGLGVDPETFQAVVRLTISNDLGVPVDTRASVTSDGLLGADYLKLELGRMSTFVKAGEKITCTRDVKTIEQTIGEPIYGLAGQDSFVCGN